MFKKIVFTIFLVLTVFSFVPIEFALAQSSASQQVYLPISQLNFVGVQGVANLSRTLIVVGLTNQSVNVTLAPTDLYDNSTGHVIPASSIEINSTFFSLSQSNEQTINVVVTTSSVPVGTYQGAVALISTNTTTTATTTIPITVNIEPLSASSTQQQVYLPISQLNFVGEQGAAPLSRTLVVVGLANQTINVKLVATDLYDNTTGKNIPASSVIIDYPSFNLSQSTMTVKISIKTPGVALFSFQPTIYQGAIVLTSTNATTTVTSSIPVIVKIEPFGVVSYQLWLFIAMLVLITLSLICGEVDSVQVGPIKRFVKFIVVFLGIFAVGIYFSLILSTSLIDTGNLIYTALITPFVAYLIYYVKNLRDERKSLEDAARNLRNQNIGKDLDTLENLMGELTTHYASFTSEIHKDGSLSSEVWKKERKQGTASDFPLLRLEQYYSYITIYNYSYSKAIGLKKAEVSPAFIDFRNKYAELENLLFVNLEYDLGSLTALDLSPLQMEYPRITKPLLNTLVDSGVLKAPKMSLSYKDLQRISKKIYLGENTEKFLEYVGKQFNVKYKELMALAIKLPTPPDEPEKPKGGSQIKGTYTVDVKDLKKVLGKGDGTPSNNMGQEAHKN